MLKFAIIGLGGLGKVHLKNVEELMKNGANIQLMALCDVEESRFTEQTKTNLGNNDIPLDLSQYSLYTSIEELLDKEKLDFVITALPTYLHAEVAVMILNRGIHVFSEKPMALNLQQCQNMIDAANQSNKLLMIGQCLRYMPSYVKLKEFVDSKEFGEVIRAEFSRYSHTPTWTWQNWMMDVEKSGGAALDLHVHDVDFINWAFGLPETVRSVATHKKLEYESINTLYQYDDKYITCCGDWGLTDSYGFVVSYFVRFEKAVVVWNADGLFVHPQEGDTYEVELDSSDAYFNEIVDFIDCIQSNRKSSINPPESVMNSLKLALLEKESAQKGETLHVQ